MSAEDVAYVLSCLLQASPKDSTCLREGWCWRGLILVVPAHDSYEQHAISSLYVQRKQEGGRNVRAAGVRRSQGNPPVPYGRESSTAESVLSII